MTILITGARGRIARAVHAGLVSSGREVRVASREPDLPGTVALDSASLSSWSTALKDISQVFLYSDPSTAAVFVEAAEAAGVEQVVLLSSMASHADNQNAAANPHSAAEREILGGSFATTVLQPGTFMTNAIFWSDQVRATGQLRLPYLEAEEAPIHEQDIADVAIRVLLDGPGGEHDGRGYPMSGPESMTRRRQLDLITELTGVPIEQVELTPAQAREEMAASMRNPAQLESLMSYWASRVGTPHPIEHTVELLTGHAGRTFEQWLKDNPTAFLND